MSGAYLFRRARLRVEASRFAFVILLLITSVSFAGTTDPNWTRDDAAHLLRRAGFGGTPVQIDRLHALGREQAVNYLITGNLPAEAQAPFAAVDLKPFTFDESFDSRRPGPMTAYELQQLRAWWIDRMVRTDRPLEEKMSLFWHGLFTSGIREVRNVQWIAAQNALFHREALGNYKRLTHEIIHDPAMIRYLNNDQNLKGRPNENLARELMELFTMGEGNGYAEKDIPQVARALTGLTVRPRGDASIFLAKRHDDGPKTIFGKTGNYVPDDVVNLIFDRPYPATHLARKLWIFFGTPDPSQADVSAVASALKAHNWDVAPALRVLFTSPDFYSDQTKDVLIKSPVELEVSTLRLLQEPSQPRLLDASAGVLRQMGEELFQPPNVKGWPGGEHWITSGTVFARYRLCQAMATGVFGANFGGPGRGKFGQKPGTIKANKNRAAGQENPANQGNAVSEQAAKNDATAKGDVAAKAADDVKPGKKNADVRRAKVEAQRQAERQQVLALMAKLPPLPPASEMVAPAKLFAPLGNNPSASQLVDAAVERFIQHPLPAEKKAALVEALGAQPLELDQPQSDQRVRRMIGLLLSTPEYQVE